MTCAQYDTAFKASEQQLSNEIIKRKYKLKNTYWGKVPTGGEFPRNSGTSIKKIRLSRIGFGKMDVGWEQLEDNGCQNNLCAQPERETINRGWEESFYSIERFGFATDDICLSVLPFREMPEEELAHYEKGIMDFAVYAWEEYAKSRWHHYAANKICPTLSDDQVSSSGACDILKNNCTPNFNTDGYVWWRRNPASNSTATGSGPIDERFISVNIAPNRLGAISELTVDCLEFASRYLELDDENMRFIDEGIDMHDVILADPRMGTRMAQLERMQEGACVSTIYDAKELKRTLGTQRIFRDRYSVRYDTYAPRFYPDTLYNTTILPNAGAYSPLNPDTWPRFVRVLPQVQVRNPNGTSRYIVNQDYIYAPFGLSCIFTPTVYKIRSYPETASVGSAMKGDIARDYSGKVKWINEFDKTCNPRKEIGHWELDLGAAAEPDRPENGYSYIHRIDHTVALAYNSCAITEATCGTQLTTFCYGGTVGGEEAVTASSRGANYADKVNSQKWGW